MELSLQSDSVLANSTGPSIFDRYNRDIDMIVKLYEVIEPFGTKYL
jgi:hypothetical protein